MFCVLLLSLAAIETTVLKHQQIMYFDEFLSLVTAGRQLTLKKKEGKKDGISLTSLSQAR